MRDPIYFLYLGYTVYTYAVSDVITYADNLCLTTYMIIMSTA